MATAVVIHVPPQAPNAVRVRIDSRMTPGDPWTPMFAKIAVLAPGAQAVLEVNALQRLTIEDAA